MIFNQARGLEAFGQGMMQTNTIIKHGSAYLSL